MPDFVTVRLEVNHLRHTVMAAIDTHAESFRNEAQQAVDKALAEFDFQELITEHVRGMLPDLIRSMMKDVVRSVFWENDELRRLLHQEVGKAILGRALTP